MFALKIIATVFTALCLAAFVVIMKSAETKQQKIVCWFLVITNILNVVAMWG